MPLCRATVAHRVQAQTLLPSPLHRPRRALRNSPEHNRAASFTFDRPQAALLGVQLRSRPTATKHAVACRQMLTQELLAEGAHIATQALSAGPAFRSRSAAVARCVRRQHLIVAPTNPGAQPALQYAHSSTKNCRNPSLTHDIEAPHISPPFCPLLHHPLFGDVKKQQKPLTVTPLPPGSLVVHSVSRPPLQPRFHCDDPTNLLVFTV